MWRAGPILGALAVSAVLLQGASAGAPEVLDREAQRWVTRTLRQMTLEERIGQLIVPGLESLYYSTDSDEFERLAGIVREQRVGGFLVFGGRQAAPGVLLNPGYGSVILGQPLAAASLLNRLQALSAVPLLNAGDFEAGAGFRIGGATVFPRAMAFGAVGDERLAHDAGRFTAREARALGVHVNFAPVVDVNNNPRNPVINTRSFGEDPGLVSRLASAYVEGLEREGMLATLKHFPGHGDTDVDTHLGLATVPHARERLEQIEWAPFRAGVAAGASALMTGHIELPALDPTPGTPSTFSRAMVAGFVRDELGFDGLVYTDSMRMQAVSQMVPPEEAAARAIAAGNDVLLDPPDAAAAFNGIRAAVEAGRIDPAQIERSVERGLRAKARLGLHKTRAVSLDAVPAVVGARLHEALAQEVSQRALTLVRDEQQHVPLAVPRDGSILYLSILDYPAGWAIAAPSRSFIPELRSRWPDVTAIELSDRTSRAELDLVRASLRRYDAVVAGIFVRTASFSGRMDLAPQVLGLLRHAAEVAASTGQPLVAVFFGNPYAATFLPELPAILLTYDFYDRPEVSAVRALAGEAAIAGRLPIALPGLAPVGHGLDRVALSGAPP